MTLTVSRFLLIFAVGLTIGCQSMNGQRTAAVASPPPPLPSTIQTVKADSQPSDHSPIVLLIGDLQSIEEPSATGSQDQSLWSKLSEPTRFLLPRTDTESAKTLETPQALDDGF
jgi:hypothetical protein